MLFTPGSMITIYPHSYPKLQYKPSYVLPISTGLYTAFGLGVGPAASPIALSQPQGRITPL